MDLYEKQRQLIQSIQSGQESLLPILWGTVERFVFKQANAYYNAMRDNFPMIDRFELISCGYIAMTNAVKTYNLQAGKRFAGWLMYYCRKEWRNLYGIDTPELDRFALRLDAPISEKDDDLTLADTLQDVTAPTPEDAAEQADSRSWLKSAIDDMVDALPVDMGEVIKAEYFNGKPLKHIAAELGVDASVVYKHKKSAIQRLKRATKNTPIGRQVRAHYMDYRRNIKPRFVGLNEFRATHTSQQEEFVLRCEAAEKKALRSMKFYGLSKEETIALSALKCNNHHILSDYVRSMD